MTRILTALAIVVGVIIVSGTESSASLPPGGSGLPTTIGGHPCLGDFDKFCAGKVVCGKGACHDCLNEHMARLSKECVAVMHKWDEEQENQLGRDIKNR